VYIFIERFLLLAVFELVVFAADCIVSRNVIQPWI